MTSANKEARLWNDLSDAQLAQGEAIARGDFAAIKKAGVAIRKANRALDAHFAKMGA